MKKEIKFDVNNPISPSDRMPVPNKFFFVRVIVEDMLFLKPAILKCYTDAANFYENCAIFNEQGFVFKLGANERPAGWIEMFSETKTYNIIHV